MAKNSKKVSSYILKNEPNLLDNKKIDDLLNRGDQYKEKYIYKKDKLDEKGKKIINPKTGKAIKEKVIEEVDVDSASLIASNLHFAFDSAGWFWENLDNVTANNKNINNVADNDDVFKVSQCINGVVSEKNLYGLKERRDFTASLKDILEYKNLCKSIKKKE